MTIDKTIQLKEAEIDLLQFKMNKYIKKIQAEQYAIKKQIEVLKNRKLKPVNF